MERQIVKLDRIGTEANKVAATVGEALPGIPWSNEEAVLVLAFESADHPLDAWMKRALEICADHGGVPDPSGGDDENAHRSGAAGAWRNKFIRAPHYSEHAVARGILAIFVDRAAEILRRAQHRGGEAQDLEETVEVRPLVELLGRPRQRQAVRLRELGHGRGAQCAGEMAMQLGLGNAPQVIVGNRFRHGGDPHFFSML